MKGFRRWQKLKKFFLKFLRYYIRGISRRACLPPRIHSANKDERAKLRPFVTVETFLIGDRRSRSARARASVLSHATWITLKGHPAAFDARVRRAGSRASTLGTLGVSRRASIFVRHARPKPCRGSSIISIEARCVLRTIFGREQPGIAIIQLLRRSITDKEFLHVRLLCSAVFR